ncbi:hypothetical protein J3459_014242 [Metarhizium acridum]|nr:hypothetical protein J3459_014242 [Metarhizium acridum]
MNFDIFKALVCFSTGPSKRQPHHLVDQAAIVLGHAAELGEARIYSRRRAAPNLAGRHSNRSPLHRQLLLGAPEFVPQHLFTKLVPRHALVHHLPGRGVAELPVSRGKKIKLVPDENILRAETHMAKGKASRARVPEQRQLVASETMLQKARAPIPAKAAAESPRFEPKSSTAALPTAPGYSDAVGNGPPPSPARSPASLPMVGSPVGDTAQTENLGTRQRRQLGV